MSIKVEDRIVIIRMNVGYLAFCTLYPGRVYYGRSYPEAFGRLVGDCMRKDFNLPKITDEKGSDIWVYFPEPLNDKELEDFNQILIENGKKPLRRKAG
jgi:hypothetical protein